MSRHWAILIGINQYQQRQPLLRAHEDAQALYRYLTQAAGVAPATCILLSDRSPKVGQAEDLARGTVPSADPANRYAMGIF
jgi:uncharacterized caspase-like protein